MTERRAAISALTFSTLAFTVCFAAWVMNAVLVTFLVNNGVFAFDEAQVGWLLAVPVLTGAFSRVPLGLLTDRIGGRPVLAATMFAAAASLWAISYANSYLHFLLGSLAFGIAGGSFAVGAGYVSRFFEQKRQGTALGIFGAGNAGAAITTTFSPLALRVLTDGGTQLEGWRMLPRAYAAILAIMAVLFWVFTVNKKPEGGRRPTLRDQLAPLGSPVVWRFGLYYFLVFGGFVALAQWIVPYALNVYRLSLAEAGLIASVFILPSGLVRAAGGWLSDRFGARAVMYWVFLSCTVACVILSVPKMSIESPGEGVLARKSGTVTAVTDGEIVVGDRVHAFRGRPTAFPAEHDDRSAWLPSVRSWQEPVVEVGREVQKKELLARGLTSLNYPANIWVFIALVFVFGVATGVGKAGVYKLIPEKFPGSVGAVGGMVGLLGALGGFVFPPLWGYLLGATGLWSSAWVVLAVLSAICLAWLGTMVRRIVKTEAPELSRLMEYSETIHLLQDVPPRMLDAKTAEDALRAIPFFDGLSSEELRALQRLGREETVPAGAPIFEAGAPGDVMYVILRGEVQIFRTTPEGERQVLSKLGPGRFFGELALIDGRPRAAAAVAQAATELFLVDRSAFHGLLARSPRMMADVLVGLSGMIRKNLELLAAAKEPKASQSPDRGHYPPTDDTP